MEPSNLEDGSQNPWLIDNDSFESSSSSHSTSSHDEMEVDRINEDDYNNDWFSDSMSPEKSSKQSAIPARAPEASYFTNSASSYYRSEDMYITRPDGIQSLESSHSDANMSGYYHASGWYSQATSQTTANTQPTRTNARRRLFDTSTLQLTSETNEGFRQNREMFGPRNNSSFQNENIFSELSLHIRALIAKVGTNCPHTSPVKVKAVSASAPSLNVIKALLMTTYEQKNILALNEDLLEVAIYNGNNYALMINRAARLNLLLNNEDQKFHFVFANLSESSSSTKHIEEIKQKCSIIELVMLDLLCGKYPLMDGFHIYGVLKHSKCNFFERYRDADQKLDKISLNSSTLENYFSKNDLSDLSDHPTTFYRDARGRPRPLSFLMGSDSTRLENGEKEIEEKQQSPKIV